MHFLKRKITMSKNVTIIQCQILTQTLTLILVNFYEFGHLCLFHSVFAFF